MSGSHRKQLPALFKTGRVLAPAAALTAVVTGTAYYANTGATLDLSVDGNVRQVTSRADTVGGLLAAQSIAVSPDDEVVPDVDTALDDGDTVEVRYARPLALTVDGRTTTHSTTGLTLGEALDDLGIEVGQADVSMPLRAPLPPEGTAVTLTNPKRLTLVVGGKARTVTSTAATVGDLLDDSDVSVSPTDRLSHAAGTAVSADMTVRVVRVRSEKVTRTERVAFDTTERKDSSLTKGTRKTVTAGVNGQRRATYRVTYTNGKTTAKKLLSSSVIKEPVDAVVKVGTKAAPASSSSSSGGSGSSGGSSSGAAGLNWAALAECESSGNPRAVNPAGYYGLYQFSLSTWRSVGGSGSPADASSGEQTRRAQILYDKAGAGQWPVCGRKLFT